MPSSVATAEVDLDFWKGGSARSVIIVEVGLAGIYTLIVCLHADTKGSEGMPPGNFKKFHCLRSNQRAFLIIYLSLMSL